MRYRTPPARVEAGPGASCCQALNTVRASITDGRALADAAEAACGPDGTPESDYLRALLAGGRLALNRVADAAGIR